MRRQTVIGAVLTAILLACVLGSGPAIAREGEDPESYRQYDIGGGLVTLDVQEAPLGQVVEQRLQPRTRVNIIVSPAAAEAPSARSRARCARRSAPWRASASRFESSTRENDSRQSGSENRLFCHRFFFPTPYSNQNFYTPPPTPPHTHTPGAWHTPPIPRGGVRVVLENAGST